MSGASVGRALHWKGCCPGKQTGSQKVEKGWKNVSLLMQLKTLWSLSKAFLMRGHNMFYATIKNISELSSKPILI